MSLKFKKLSEVTVVEGISDSAHVLVEDGGEVKRVAKDVVGGSLPEGIGGIPIYTEEDLTRELKLELVKNKTIHFLGETYNIDGGAKNVHRLSDGYVAHKAYSGECGDSYPSCVECTNSSSYLDRLWEIDNPTDAEIDEILAAWGVS